MTTKMTVSRALAELKRIQDRIQRANTGGTFLVVLTGEGQHRKVLGSNQTPDQAAALIQGCFDQIDALQANRQELKAAIILSNAKTLVTIAGEEITVAEAIELKSTLPVKEALLSNLRLQLLRARQQVDSGNAALDQQVDKLLTAAYGSDKTKIDPSVHDSIAAPQRALKAHSLLDPCKIEERIKKLEEEVSVLKTEIDFVLSESNATTSITVDF